MTLVGKSSSLDMNLITNTISYGKFFFPIYFKMLVNYILTLFELLVM